MKKLIFTIMMTMMLIPVLVSCSKDDESAPKNYATEKEIQGSWICNGEYATYMFEFNKPRYTIYAKSGKNTEIETGTYTVRSAGEIYLTPSNVKTSSWSPLRAYWEGSGKKTLHFYPVGTFVRGK